RGSILARNSNGRRSLPQRATDGLARPAWWKSDAGGRCSNAVRLRRATDRVPFAVELGATRAAIRRLLATVSLRLALGAVPPNCMDPFGRLSSPVMSKPLLSVGAFVLAASSLACGPSYDEHT